MNCMHMKQALCDLISKGSSSGNMGFIYVFILTWAMVDLLELYCAESQSNQDSFNVSTQPHVILPLLRGVMFSSLSAGWVAC